MSDVDPRIERALAGLRREWGPPAGGEQAMLADFHARLAQRPEPPEPPEPESSLPVRAEPLAELGYAAKVVAATLVTTALGLGVVAGVGRALQSEPSAKPRHEQAHEQAHEHEQAPERDTNPPQRGTARSAVGEANESDLATSQPTPAVTKRSTTPARTRASEPDTLDLEAELALLQAAEAAAGETSIEQLEQHAKRFPSGALASEREGLWIVRLCELGRTSEAGPRADRFAREHATSLMNERIRGACSK